MPSYEMNAAQKKLQWYQFELHILLAKTKLHEMDCVSQRRVVVNWDQYCKNSEASE